MPVAALATPWDWGPPASRLPLDPARTPQWRVAGRTSAAEGPTAGTGWTAVRGPAVAVAGWLVGGSLPTWRDTALVPEGLVRRFTSTAGSITERLLVPLDVPAVLWELVAEDAAAPIDVQLHPPSPGTVLGGSGEGPPRAAATGRISGHGRLALAAVAEAEASRLWTLLASRGADGLAGHRARAIAAAQAAGPRFESPDPALDAAFAWALGEVAATGPGEPPRPDGVGAAEPVRRVLADLWGLRLDGGGLEVAPTPPVDWPRMALHGLRVAGAVVDLRFARRPGQVSLDLRVRSGGPLPLAVALPGAGHQLLLDDAAIAGPWARFLAAAEHHLAVLLP